MQVNLQIFLRLPPGGAFALKGSILARILAIFAKVGGLQICHDLKDMWPWLAFCKQIVSVQKNNQCTKIISLQKKSMYRKICVQKNQCTEKSVYKK